MCTVAAFVWVDELDDPEIAFDSIDLECRYFVEAGVNACEVGEPSGALADDEEALLLAITDDESSRYRVIAESNGGQTGRGKKKRRSRLRRRLALRFRRGGLGGRRPLAFPCRRAGAAVPRPSRLAAWRQARAGFCGRPLVSTPRRRSRRRRARARQLRFELRPPGQRPDALEIVVRRRVRRDAHRHKALQHHERIAGPAAQALCPCQHRHVRRIVLGSGLQRSPREIVKGVVVLALRGGERLLLALLPLAALLRRQDCAGRGGKTQDNHDKKSGKRNSEGYAGHITMLSVRSTR